MGNLVTMVPTMHDYVIILAATAHRVESAWMVKDMCTQTR